MESVFARMGLQASNVINKKNAELVTMVSSVTRVASVTVHLVMLLVAFAIAQLVKCYHPVPTIVRQVAMATNVKRRVFVKTVLLVTL